MASTYDPDGDNDWALDLLESVGIMDMVLATTAI